MKSIIRSFRTVCVFAVAFAAAQVALAFEPIRINFNDNANYDVDGWTSVSYKAATNGVDCGQGVAMKLTGAAGWLYGDTVQTNKLQKIYVDSNGNGTHLTFSGLSNGVYTVKAYFACDWGNQFSALRVNGVDFTYVDGAVGMGSTSWGDAAEKAMGLGTNVIEVTGVSIYDSELVLSAYGKENNKRNGFAAVEIAPYEFTAETPSTISINVASDDLKSGTVSKSIFVPGLAGGEIPGYAWLNVSSKSNHFENVAYWDGAKHEIVTNDTGIVVDATGPWVCNNGSASGENFFLRYYLDDNGSEPKISVSGIPFKLYDVIVYLNADYTQSGQMAFNPVNINETKYSYDYTSGSAVKGSTSWGTRGFTTAIAGTNALRVAGLLDSSLSVLTGGRSPARGGFAAMQIVKRDYADIVAEGDISTRAVNGLAGGKKEVVLTLPAGATLTITKRLLDCDTLYVISEGDIRIVTRNNIEPEDGTGYAANLAKINTDQVKGLVFHGWKPTKRIISLNFNSEKNSSAMPSTWTFAGGLAAEEMVSAAWNNLPSADDGTNETPVVWNGDLHMTNSIEGLSVEWTNAGRYSGGSSEDVFRRSWFDGNQRQAVITINNLPFEKYDVIVYENWDGGSYGYGAPWVNGSQWTYDSETNKVIKGSSRWGNNNNGAKAEMKVNAIRVPDQTDSTCVIKTAGYCGNICAVQIIEYCPPVKEKSGFTILFY